MSNEPKKPPAPAARSNRYQSPPPITRPELRQAFIEHGITPRRATEEERKTERHMPAVRPPHDERSPAKEPPPAWVGELLAPLLERLAEREEDRRGRRDSIVDATEKATDATEKATDATELATTKKNELEEVVSTVTKWWKLGVFVLGVVAVGGSACGSTIFGYLSASKGAADNTKDVATETAEKVIKEAPKPVERERVIYVERAAAPLPSGSVYVPQIPERNPTP